MELSWAWRTLVVMCLMGAARPQPAAVELQAQRLELDPQGQGLEAHGGVTLRWGGLRLRCAHLRVELLPGGGPRRLLAWGGVELWRGQERFRAPRVTYDGGSRRWRAEGGVELQWRLPPGSWPDPAATVF